MIPPILLALLSLATAIGLYRESRKKTQLYFRLRWACMALPFLYQAGGYIWVTLNLPTADDRAIVLRIGNFMIVLLATLYFTGDLIHDIKAVRSQKHE